MIDRVPPQRPYAKDDLAHLKRNAPLNTPHDNEMAVLRRAARAAREDRSGQVPPRFLTREHQRMLTDLRQRINASDSDWLAPNASRRAAIGRPGRSGKCLTQLINKRIK